MSVKLSPKPTKQERHAVQRERVEQERERQVRDERQAARRMRRAQSRKILSALILFHLFAVVIWLLPGSALTEKFLPRVRPYMTATGFMQSWYMFTPNPIHIDVTVEARITYADGKVRSWSFPRMVDMGYVERYRRERFRKFIEVAHQDRYRFLWPTLARYAARRNNTDPRNPPKSVELIRRFLAVPPPPIPLSRYQFHTFFTMPVKPQDLR